MRYLEIIPNLQRCKNWYKKHPYTNFLRFAYVNSLLICFHHLLSCIPNYLSLSIPDVFPEPFRDIHHGLLPLAIQCVVPKYRDIYLHKHSIVTNFISYTYVYLASTYDQFCHNILYSIFPTILDPVQAKVLHLIVMSPQASLIWNFSKGFYDIGIFEEYNISCVFSKTVFIFLSI